MKKFSSSIVKIETAVAGVCLASSTTLIFLAAAARSVDRPINWSLDISLFLFAWATFLGADVAFRADKLVNVDVLVDRLPERGARVLKALNYLLIFVFLVGLVIYGFISVYKSRQRAFQGIPSVSYSWVSLSLPVGCVLLAQTTASKIIAIFRPELPGQGRADAPRGADAMSDADHESESEL